MHLGSLRGGVTEGDLEVYVKGQWALAKDDWDGDVFPWRCSVIDCFKCLALFPVIKIDMLRWYSQKPWP